jgi:hypothetical protein
VSKERARRRVEREALQEAQRAARARQVARRARRRAVVAAVRRPLVGLAGLVGLGGRRRPPDSALRRMRARQDGALAAALVSINGVLWLFEPSWLLRGGAAVTSVLAWPLLIVLVFDRRSQP